MMYYLHKLSEQFGGFNVFSYVTFRAVAAAVTAFNCSSVSFAAVWATSRTFCVARCHGGNGAFVNNRALNGAAFMIPTPLDFR